MQEDEPMEEPEAAVAPPVPPKRAKRYAALHNPAVNVLQRRVKQSPFPEAGKPQNRKYS